MKITKAQPILALTLLACLAVACQSNKPNSHGNVYRQWSQRMSEMGIFPIYPPREDVAVGDVYVLPLHPYDTAAVGYIGGLGNAGYHVDYLGDTNLGWTNLLIRLNRYYAIRPYPADSTNGTLGGTNFPLTAIPGYQDAQVRTGAFQQGSVARLRQVSFPDFNITHIDQESLSAVIPIEGIMAGLNFNRSDISAVHFSIPQAESYGLSTENLMREALDEKHFVMAANGEMYLKADPTNGIISVGGARLTSAMFEDAMKHVGDPDNNKMPSGIRAHLKKSGEEMHDQIYLALISEVYFARSMDITIDRKTATGASASGRPITSGELKTLKDMGLLATQKMAKSTTTTQTNSAATAASSNTNIVSGTKAELVDVAEGDTAYDLAKKLRSMDVDTSIDKIGASVKVVSVTASSIGLRRTFQRPICVGVRGVLLKIYVGEAYQFDEATKTATAASEKPITDPAKTHLKIMGVRPWNK